MRSNGGPASAGKGPGDGPRHPEDGVLLVDKPAGVTSHDVVAQVRRDHDRIKTGHAGTLDPFATGLLLVLLGRATRVQRWLMELPKTYEVTARYGWRSTTGDRDGEITKGKMPESFELPTGVIRQRPPAYSAIKVGGKRAYALARAGETVELPEREVTVYEATRVRSLPETGSYRTRVSSGTYIRALIADLNDAYCEELRRTHIGPFSVEQAGTFLPLNDAVGFIPEVRLEGAHAKQAAHGVAVPGEADGTVRLTDEHGLIALAEPRPEGLKPIVGFRG